MADSVVYGTLGLERPWSIETYRSIGGYEAWERIVREGTSRDDIIDEMNRAMYDALQIIMSEHPDTIKRSIHTLSISRHLERIADLTTNIAEDVIYMIEGEIVRHRTESYFDT